ncbi:MerR family transcriptional regulator [Kineosporia mesophila]|uniref:MerR family transcriptional regulator n=1 Tax=Kineosporia mesophila TaxID=566012 RepID=A0ABP7AWF4_9ACTN|nr:MerR family transcriptional regulator [Kineosporia mesophila]MCD5354065.1 MerR family transcriptional regulator [Kineosporia mesophila]
MRIGDLSARTGVSQRSLRYYENQGLLSTTRSPGGQRHYDEADVPRVQEIRAFLAAGLPTRVIAGLLNGLAVCRAAPDADEALHSWETLSRERSRITSVIDELVTARHALDELLAVNHAFLKEHPTAR